MEKSGKLMGIDYGERRLGIALSDASKIIATGYCTIDCERDPDFLNTIKNIAMEEGVESLVVGYPYRTDGKPGGKTEDVERFIQKLQRILPLPLHRQDESYSSQKAEDFIRMRGSKKKKKRNKAEIDRVAASVILQDYLNRNSGI